MREAMAEGQMMHLVCAGAGSSFALCKARQLFVCSSFRSAADGWWRWILFNVERFF